MTHTTPEKVERLLDLLAEELCSGIYTMRVAQRLYEAFELTRSLSPRSYLWAGIYDACISQAFLSVAKLLIPHGRDLVTVQYLLDTAEQNPGLFRHASQSQLIKRAQADRQYIGSLPFLPELKDQRHQRIAHISRTLVNQPSKAGSRPVVCEEVMACMVDLSVMVCAYREWYDRKRYYLGYVCQNVDRDFDHLVGCLSAGSAHAQARGPGGFMLFSELLQPAPGEPGAPEPPSTCGPRSTPEGGA